MKESNRNTPGGGQDGMPSRLTLHGPHSVLRKVSKALRVRINPSLNKKGPYIVIEEVTSKEVTIIAQILEG
jgi:hypothetical protein